MAAIEFSVLIGTAIQDSPLQRGVVQPSWKGRWGAARVTVCQLNIFQEARCNSRDSTQLAENTPSGIGEYLETLPSRALPEAYQQIVPGTYISPERLFSKLQSPIDTRGKGLHPGSPKR
jgi:hypothetical protein